MRHDPVLPAAHVSLRLCRPDAAPPGGRAVGPWVAALEHADPQGRLVTVCERPGVVAALLGTLYDQTLDGALNRYHTVGDGFAAELEGSFALVILDLEAGRALALTDRVGIRTLYARHTGEAITVSTRPDHPDFSAGPLSVAAVASMLANGYLASGLTLYDGVRALTPSDLHDLRVEGIRSAPYWTLPFHPAEQPRPVAADAADLIEVLRAATARRVRASGERPYLSLSGGYDSRGLLGLLRPACPNLRTYAYTLPPARRGSDADIARRLAAQFGTAHEEFVAFRGDLPASVRRNAAHGHGAAPYAEEIDALMDLVARQPTDIFTGEQVFELRTTPAASTAHHLDRVHINAFAALAWLEPLLPDGVYTTLQGAWAPEYRAVAAQSEQWSHWYHRELELLLRQYEPWGLLPWRERYTGQHANVHMPYLDTAVLEFMGHLPVNLMTEKHVLKVALRQMEPALFRVPLASTQGYEANWRRELRALDADALDALLGCPSRLDDLVAPDALRRLILALPEGDPSVRARATAAVRGTLGTWRRSAVGQRVFGRPTVKPRVPDLPAIILKLLTLRAVLRR